MSMIIRALQGKNRIPNAIDGLGSVLSGELALAVSAMYGNFLYTETIKAKYESTKPDTTESERTILGRRVQFLKRMMLNIVQVTANLFMYYFGNFAPTQPAAMLAGIPLGTVEELSHAMSMEDLKYRAKGGIFLAHQGGGSESLRISGKTWGANRFLFLIFLDLLFRYGEGKIVDMFEGMVLGQANTDIHKFGPELVPWQEFNENAIDEGREEYHMTFPVITRQRVYLNMFIETYEFTESIENGLNCITYTIFLRKYLPPPEFMFTKVITPYPWVEEDDIGEETIYYAENYTDPFITNLARFTTAAEFGLTASLLSYRMFLILSGNSSEENIALITSYNQKAELFGEDTITDVYKQRYKPMKAEYNLTGLSTANKEEMMVDV